MTAQTDNRVYDGTTSSAVAPVVGGAALAATRRHRGDADLRQPQRRHRQDADRQRPGRERRQRRQQLRRQLRHRHHRRHHAAPLTVTAQTDNRVYDGTTSSAVAPVVGGAACGDAIGTAATQTFDNRNVGTGKTLTASGLVVNDGNGGNNYAVTYVADTTGVITAAPLTVTAQTDNRVYDGTTSSAVAPVVGGAVLAATRSAPRATQTFDNRNVGTGKTLTASGLVMNDGNGGNNYAISYVDDTTGEITPAALTLNADQRHQGL